MQNTSWWLAVCAGCHSTAQRAVSTAMHAPCVCLACGLGKSGGDYGELDQQQVVQQLQTACLADCECLLCNSRRSSEEALLVGIKG